MRVFIGGVGYRNLRDHSAGVLIIDRLMADEIGPDVTVEDASYNPIALVQRLQDEPAGRSFGRVIIVSAVPRGGTRTPGAITAYRWDGVLPDSETIQRAVVDAVTGIINVDNTAIVCRHFGALPDQVVFVEIEPLEHEFGDSLSPAVAAAIEPACTLITHFARGTLASLPLGPLGGGAAVGIGAW